MDSTALREREIKLMWLAICIGYRTVELATLNQCCMYMRATYLSDICNAMGTKIKQHLWSQPTVLNSPYQWPSIPKPTPSEWQMWQQALWHALSLGNNLSLPIPLGRWAYSTKPRTGWVDHEEENAIYHCMPTTHTRHTMIPWQSRMQLHGKGEIVGKWPSSREVKVALVAQVGLWIILTGIGKTLTSLTTQGQ